MNLLKLKYFHAVATEGGFTKAAAALRVAQPSLSKMVRELETEIGVALLERDGRGIRLTPKGEKVLAHAERIFNEVESLEKSLGAIRGKVQGPLVVGTTDLIATEVLPLALAALMAAYPALYPVLQTGTSSSLIEFLRQRKIEIALLFHIPEINTEDVVVESLASVPFTLVVAREYARDLEVLNSFIGSREVDAQSVRRFPALEKLRGKYPNAKIRISTNSLGAHLEMVKLGLGVAVLPRFLVEKDLRKGRLVSVLSEHEVLNFDLKLVKRRNSRLSLNAEKFLEVVRDTRA